MTEEKVLLQATVCYPMKGRQVLMAKKAKKIGAGRWNGYGGGPEAGDKDIFHTASRELYEESGLTASPDKLEKIAIMDFRNTKSDGEEFVCRVHFFVTQFWTGVPKETPEMLTPTWFSIDDLPFAEMMPSDQQWLPLALSGQKIIGSAHLGPFQKELIGPVSVKKVDYLP